MDCSDPLAPKTDQGQTGQIVGYLADAGNPAYQMALMLAANVIKMKNYGFLKVVI